MSDDKKQLAYQDYIKGMKYKDIAEKYNVSLATVKSWKTRYKWTRDNKSMHTKEVKSPKSKNSIAKLSESMKGNKNSIRTGEFESIIFDDLQEDELLLLEHLNLDKIKMIVDEIKILTIREKRMIKRISEANNGDDESFNLINSIEEALTRIQDKKSRNIDLLHKFEMDKEKLEFEKEKHNYKLKSEQKEEEDSPILLEMLSSLKEQLQ